jgi:hypothetical protein
MLSGLNLLKLFITSLSTRKGRKISLLMFYLDVIPCSLNLIIKFFVGSLLKSCMLRTYTSKMLMKFIEREERGINICCMVIFCSVLTSCVFQLVLFAFCFYRKHMDVI